MPTLDVSTMLTPIGPLTILMADDTIRAGGFTEDASILLERLPRELQSVARRPCADLGAVTDALRLYFCGELAALDDLPVEQVGGAFQQRAWNALRGVAPGVQTTYRSLAIGLGGDQLARAVGMACASNLISPIVPCHRITGSDGSLTGYLWGLDRKRWLLDHERRHAHVAGCLKLVPA
jgi:methylated-DNA-[protein]-cysteine S-methyltransferase